MEVRQVTTEETIPLRSLVLRPGHPLSACHFPNDSASVHFGVYVEHDLLAIVTAHPEDKDLFAREGQWRIRGMATHPRVQGKGLGGAGLQALLVWGRQHGVPLFWCNAREGAIPFYLKHGFHIDSDLFEISGVGPHKVMHIDL